LWLRHNLKVSLRRNRLIAGCLSGALNVMTTVKTIVLAIVLSAAAGCTTTGMGYGNIAGDGEKPVTFRWHGTDPVSGTMSATLPDGVSYSGPYFQITQQTSQQMLGPLWDGWGYGWGEWGWPYYWGDPPADEFVTRYSGKVVANLTAKDGSRVRCRFRLAYPAQGMAGGGQGQCQLKDGKTIDVTFPTA
jgi:hypothetical protein